MNNDWIDWKGGECPLPLGTRYDIRYRDGLELHGEVVRDKPRLNKMLWSNTGNGDDYVAYRVVENIK